MQACAFPPLSLWAEGTHLHTHLDIRYSNDSGKTGADYPNTGGRETEALMSDIGLVDAFQDPHLREDPRSSQGDTYVQIPLGHSGSRVCHPKILQRAPLVLLHSQDVHSRGPCTP